MNSLADRLSQTNALGEVFGVVLLNASIPADLEMALAVGARHVSVVTHDAEQAEQARDTLEQAVGVQGQAWHVTTFSADEFTQTFPVRSNDQRWVLWVGGLTDVAPIVEPLNAYLTSAETGTGQAVASPFTDIVVDLPADTDVSILAPLDYVSLFFGEGTTGGQLVHLIAAPRTRTAIHKLRKERDAKQAELEQLVLDQKDLDEIRARHATLLAEYGTQSELLRKVQARMKAALDRMGLASSVK